ncbi:AMP-dependent synthetase/ligase [Streptomyces sp. NBC_01803]|uniref:AMP-dependent synthetase/ligase n=1 Tax=Streptomyces sp. NBC_01803 TaxID=2975946 RepID=UPI002DDAD8D6|nr:AMP-dependent synthetase/ligase [Streptomyces sp. NBC_01803]WSA45684.1 AMP-dependent synthetase/ligase [Streptomyces sp. NBC_01803]
MSGTHVKSPPTTPSLLYPDLRIERGVVTGASMPQLAPAVEEGSLADIPFVNAQEAPDDIALSRKYRDGTWRDVTCAEFATEVMDVAKGLIAHGLRPGDRIAIMSRTRYEWTLLDFAAWAAGLISVPIYPTSSPHQVSYILRDAGVRACAVEGVEEARMLTALRSELPDLEHLWQITAISGTETSAIGQIAAVGHDIPDSAVEERRSLLAPWLAATIIYTSGTTGVPKGCVITHANMFAEVDNGIELLYPMYEFAVDEPASTLLFLPLAHVLGRTLAIGCLRARVRLGHAPSVQTDELLADFAGFQPTFLFAIPYLLEKVYNTGRATAESMGRAASFDRAARVARRFGVAAEAAQHSTVNGPALSPVAMRLARHNGITTETPLSAVRGPGIGLRLARALYDVLVYRRIRAALGGKLRHVVCGGSPLGRQLGTFFEGAGVHIYEGYGLTETSAAVTVTPPHAPRIGTVGWPMPGTDVRIAADGEVLVRGAQIFSGYWDAERREVVSATDADGWLATGDIGSMDQDGYLTITGRKKDLIVTSNGKNVAPAPLEDALRAHPLVSQCMVVGDDRPYLTALITLDPDGLAHWQQITGRKRIPMSKLITDPELLRHLQRAIDDANSFVSTPESIRRFKVLPRDFTMDSGHLTPSMKLRRAAVLRDYATEVNQLYRKGVVER